MTRDVKVLVFALGLSGLGAAAAAAEPVLVAQAFPRPPAPIEVMPPHEVRTLVRSTGLMPEGPPLRQGDLYIQRAIDPHGRVMRVIVDGDAGAVVSIRPMPPGPRYRGAPHPRIGMLPPRFFDDEDEPVPPQAIPGVRAPAAGERLAARPPGATPVPRPRPAVAPRARAVAATPAQVPEATGSVPAPEKAPSAPVQPDASFPPVQPLE